jgi:hypothetical protein
VRPAPRVLNVNHIFLPLQFANLGYVVLVQVILSVLVAIQTQKYAKTLFVDLVILTLTVHHFQGRPIARLVEYALHIKIHMNQF